MAYTKPQALCLALIRMLFWLTIIFLLLYTGLIGYYAVYWQKVAGYKPVEAPPPDGFVSVVIAARNEAHNILRLVQALTHQTLPMHQYEVIIVDDYSTDETAALVQAFTSERIRLIQPLVPAPHSSKKRAIEAGVAAARGPLIAVTDADCVPPPEWLSLLLSFYHQKQATFIVAPVQLQSAPSLLGVFQQLDFMMLQGITAASVRAGVHSMCNGANLAYDKQAFIAVGGFAGVDKLASGDDMLLLYKIWQLNPKGVQYLKSPKVIMPTPALENWKAFFRQRIRWSSKATYYQDRRVSAVLFFVYGFNVWLFVLLLGAFINPLQWSLVFLYLLVKTIAELLLLWPAAGFFSSKKLFLFFPLLQPLHILYTVVIGLASRRRRYEWKGRITK